MPKDKFKLVNGCMEWTGKTMREAQAKRDKDLDRLFAGYAINVPIVVLAGPHVGVVFQEHNGYFAYKIHFDGADTGSTHTGSYSKRDAEWKLRHHLAQAVYDQTGDPQKHCCGCGRSLTSCTNGLDVIAPDDADGLREHKQWIRFQEECRKAQAEGANDSECHRLACERSHQ